jgi:hypothetical protein
MLEEAHRTSSLLIVRFGARRATLKICTHSDGL